MIQQRDLQLVAFIACLRDGTIYRDRRDRPWMVEYVPVTGRNGTIYEARCVRMAGDGAVAVYREQGRRRPACNDAGCALSPTQRPSGGKEDAR